MGGMDQRPFYLDWDFGFWGLRGFFFLGNKLSLIRFINRLQSRRVSQGTQKLFLQSFFHQTFD